MLPELPRPHDPLSEMLRQGARYLIARAVEAELEEMLCQHQHRCDADRHKSVVRNGYLPERELLTGLRSAECFLFEIITELLFSYPLGPGWQRLSAAAIVSAYISRPTHHR